VNSRDGESPECTPPFTATNGVVLLDAWRAFAASLRAVCREAIIMSVAASAALTISACAPLAEQKQKAGQHSIADFHHLRQQCSWDEPGSCAKFERLLVSQQAYILYYSRAVPGFATHAFVPVSGVSIHPIAVGGFR
jgi:hypothetical protein